MPRRRDKPAHRADPSLTELAARTIGERLRARRSELGLTQEAVAERMRSDFRQVQRLESGQTNFTLDSIVRITEALRFPLAELFAREPHLRISEGSERAPDLRTHGGDDNMKYGARQPTLAEEETRVFLDVGRRIAEARRRRSLSQVATAASADVTVQHLQRIERGRQNATLKTLVRICRALGMTLRDLLA